MVWTLNKTLKDDLEALRAGQTLNEDSPKKVSTPRKRKGRHEGEDPPKKKGRKKKSETTVQEDDEEHDSEAKIKNEEQDIDVLVKDGV